MHEHVETYKAARQYEKYYKALKYPPIRKKDVRLLKSLTENLKEKYGQEFLEDYGWASEVLKNPRPKFSQIEERVSLDHLRPFYRMASYNVHANSKGLFTQLGHFTDSRDVMIAGPSLAGLADPGQSTALTLSHLTINLLAQKPTIDTLTSMIVLQKASQETALSFVKANKKFK